MTTLIIASIALLCGLCIYFAFLWIPKKVKGLEATENINKLLPGINCGGCGFPGCFGYAQALANEPALLTKGSCAFTLQDEEQLKRISDLLGIGSLPSTLRKRAFIKCNGNSPILFDHLGNPTCKAASLSFSGNRQCPFSCLGLGDCIKVCPVSAISLDPEKNIAVINSQLCTGCGLCLKQCPKNLIELAPAISRIDFRCNYQVFRNVKGREKCDFGCIHCRKCFNACQENGQFGIEWNNDNRRPVINHARCISCGACVQNCPKGTISLISQNAPKLLNTC